MPDDEIIEIRFDTAVKIADFLKEELRELDLELHRSKSNQLGETAINVLRNKRTAVRAAYDELKAAGVEGFDSTVEMFGVRPPFPKKP